MKKDTTTLKRQAQELMSKNPAAIKKIPPADIRQLVEDLQVHQIGYMVVINPCLPFLPVDITIDFLNEVKLHAKSRETVLGVFQKRTTIYDENGKQISGRGFTHNTKTLPFILLSAHCYHGFPSEVVGKSNMYEFSKFPFVPIP